MMMLSRRQMLRALAVGAAVSAGGLLLPAPVLAATSRRTGTNENISTLKATGGDYTAIATWEAATDNDLVTTTTSEVLECYADGSPYAISGTVTFTGATTSSLYRRIIRGAAGQGFTGVPGAGVTFASTSDANMFTGNEANLQFQDLTLELLTASGTSSRSALSCTSAGGIIVGVLAKGVSTGNTNAGIQVTGNGLVLVNCLAYECDGNGFRVNTATAETTSLYNCTAVDNVAEGYSILNAGANVIYKNCLGKGNGTDFEAGDSPINCASSDATATGTGARINQTFTFVNAAGDDYHLATNDAGARGFGASLAADGTFAFDDDIDGATITTWSIGFDAPAATNRLSLGFKLLQ